jgi:hypothetical protein
MRPAAEAALPYVYKKYPLYGGFFVCAPCPLHKVDGLYQSKAALI